MLISDCCLSAPFSDKRAVVFLRQHSINCDANVKLFFTAANNKMHIYAMPIQGGVFSYSSSALKGWISGRSTGL
jgi:hypothetical protein